MQVNDFLSDINNLTEPAVEAQTTQAAPKLELSSNTRKYISHSQALTYSTCALQYYFRYIERLPVQRFSGPAFGTTVHKVMELFFKTKLHDNQTLRSDILKDSFQTLWKKANAEEQLFYSKTDVDFDTLATKGSIMMEQAVEKFKLIEPLYIEQDFLIPIIDPHTQKEIGPIYLKGQIDLIAKDTFGDGVNIIDHKCVAKTYAQPDVDRNDQLTTYAYAYRYLHNREERACVFNCFVKTKEPKIVTLGTTRSKKDINWLLKYYKNIIDGIQNKVWTPRKSEKCAGCSFMQQCKEWGEKPDVQPEIIENVAEEAADE